MQIEKEVSLYDREAILKTVKTFETNFDVIQGKISSIVSESEMTELANGNTTFYSKYSSLVQTTDNIVSTVSEIDTTKADKANLVSQINQSAEGIKIEANKLTLEASNLVEIINTGTTKIDADHLTLRADDIFEIIGNGSGIIKAAQLDISGGDIVSIMSNSTAKIAAKNITLEADDLVGTINEGSVTISASHVDLSGYVTIASLGSGGSTDIDGSRIVTGTISAERLDIDAIFAKNITATGTISGVTLSGATGSFSGTVNATSGSFTGTVNATSGSFTGTVNATSGSFTGTVNATSGSFTGTVNATSGSFTGTVTATSITVYDTLTMYGTAGVSATAMQISKNTLSLADLVVGGSCYKMTFGGLYGEFGSVYRNSDDLGNWILNGDVLIGQSLIVNTTLDVNSTLTVSGVLYAAGSTTSDSATANVRMASNGRIMFTKGSSSIRYKNIISRLTDEDILRLYDIPIYWFKYKEGYLNKSDERNKSPLAGFIVEDWEPIMPFAIEHNPDGSPEMWNANIVIPLMFQMIKHTHGQIGDLKRKISQLKGEISK